MAVSMLTNILEDVLKSRSEDVPKLIKMLESLAQNFKQRYCIKNFVEKDDKTQNLIVRLAVQSYCHSLKSAKLVRALDKVLTCLPMSYRTCFNLEMKVVLQNLFMSNNLANLKILSALLDQTIAAELVSHNAFHCVSSLLQDILETRSHEHDTRNVEAEKYKRCSVKLCVQVLQMFSHDVRSVFSTCPEHQISFADHLVSQKALWKRIVTSLLTSLVQISSQDITVLTGTALAMTFSYAPSSHETQTVCQNLLSVLTSGQTCMTFADMELDIGEMTSTIPEDVSIPLAAIIKGILVTCSKETLSRGNKPLLLQVLPHILKLCHGPNVHHYTAFTLLALWYKKLENIGLMDASSLPQIILDKHLQTVLDEHPQPILDEHPQAIPDGNVQSITDTKSKDMVRQESLFQVFLVPDVKCLTGSKDSNHSSFMTQDCQLLTSTLACIWPHWDSPVEGVSELVVEIFESLLTMWHQAVTAEISDYVDLCQQLMSSILTLAWYSKARYRPLRVLFTYIDCVKVAEINKQFVADLMRCMKTNQLASVACDVYKACIQQIINKYNQQEALLVWRDLWMPTLLSGLRATDSLQALKTRTYWLPPTLKLIVGSYDLLLDLTEQYLNSRNGASRHQWLFVWISVSALARDLLHNCHCRLESDFLKESLLSAEDDVKMEALRLLCSTVKRAEPMCGVERNLLEEFIPANLKTDSTAFRQNMTSALKKMFVRIRDSCLFAVRNNQMASAYFETSIQFIEWLYQLLMHNLVPGGCYQRRQTSLDLLGVVLGTFLYQPENVARKGKPQETSDILLLYAHERGLWKFVSNQSFTVFLYCLEDGVTEIQTQIYDLLLKYFTWPRVSYDMPSLNARCSARASEDTQPSSLSSLLSNNKTCGELFYRAMHLISSPRAYETHSGMLMLSMIVRGYIMRCGWTYSVNSLNAGNLSEPTARTFFGSHIVCDPATALLDELIDRMKISLAAVLENLGANFHTNLLHGLTRSLTRLLMDIACGDREILAEVKEPDWRHRLEDIISLNQRVINLVLELLGGEHNFESCPSFAEIGTALKRLISADQEHDDDFLSLTPEFQLLLSWCWLNVKESCSCLGEVTSLVVTKKGRWLLPAFVLSEIGQTFVKVLTTCRHRGAIEGSRQGLYQFCNSLMSSSTADFREIPSTILQQVLDSLSQNFLVSSVTRRSAGLPIFIQTVLQAAHRNGNKTMLMSAVEQLYDVASQPLPTEHSQFHDINQSHALHILKTIFSDASLAPQLLPRLSQMTVLVIKGFDSPSWAIRNAATQLISTLVTRIFRQKYSEEMSSSMTLEDLSSQHPCLVEFVYKKLTAYVTPRTAVRPSLYIILTLLSELAMSPVHQQSSRYRVHLQEAVLSFIASPVYSLRKLSAQAYVALSPSDKTDATMTYILQKIIRRDQTLNELHGWLLALVCVVSSGDVSCDMDRSLLRFVIDNKWLLIKFPSCLIPASALMKAVQLVLAKAEADTALLETLWQLIETWIQTISASKSIFQVGMEQCLRLCLDILKGIARASDGTARTTFTLRLDHFLHSGLSSSHNHMCEAIMDYLQSVTDHSTTDPSIQQAVLSNMAKETHAGRLLLSADLLTKLAVRGDLHLQSCDIDLSSRTKCWEKLVNFDIVIFLMQTVCFRSSNLQTACRYQDLYEWTRRLLDFSKPINNEDFRIYAARCLVIAGADVLKFCGLNMTLPGVDRILCSVISACLQLLEDTQAEVRRMVSMFVSQVSGLDSQTFSWCYPALTSLICRDLYWSSAIVSMLLDLLYTPGELTKAINCAVCDRGQVLFEPEESSAMSEIFVTEMWAYNTLQRILRSGPGHDSQASQLLQSQINLSFRELSQNFATIRDNLLAAPVFNISCDPQVFSCLLGLVALSSLQAVTTGQLVPPDVTTGQLVFPDVTTGQLVPPDVTTGQLVPPDVTTAQLVPPDVTTGQLVPPDVSTAQLVHPDFTTGQLVPLDITTEKSVTSGNVDDHNSLQHLVQSLLQIHSVHLFLARCQLKDLLVAFGLESKKFPEHA